MSLRIAHVTATFPPYRGGTGNVCYHNARELARRGHDVHVFTAAVPGAPAREPRDGVAVHRLRPLLRAGNAPILPGLVGALRGFDVVHLHCPFIFGAELAALAARLYDQPLIVTYHNDLIEPGTWRDVVFRMATFSTRYIMLNRADRVLFVSQGHAETCDQRSVYRRRGGRCAILPNGVDTTVFTAGGDSADTRASLGLPPNERLIGFVGGLDGAHHYKGLDILLTALASEALRAARLLVVGDGDLKRRYQEQARQLGIGERVRFYGEAAQEALPPLYRACDVVSMPSLVNESFGLVAVEALACGVPVVASNGPGVRSVIDHARDGLLVPPGDAPALAAALASLLGDPARRAEMGRAGRAKVAARYDWREIGERLEQIYGEALGALTFHPALPNAGEAEPAALARGER
jgi:glycosyltransferase involved in cell wall biosynthesis